MVEHVGSPVKVFFGHRSGTDKALDLHPFVFASGTISTQVDTEKKEYKTTTTEHNTTKILLRLVIGRKSFNAPDKSWYCMANSSLR